MKTLLTIPILLCLLGCATFYTGVVTVTSVVDSAMKDWAALSVAGKTTPAIDVKVKVAHDNYRQAVAQLETALIAYRANGDQGPYLAALAATKASAGQLIDLIVPLLTADKATTLKNNLAKAVK